MRASIEGRKVLVLGGVRSGKSRHAESLLDGSADRVYLATATVFDDEMRARVARHQTQRGSGWRTVEAPLELGDALTAHGQAQSSVLLDSLGMWLNNVMYAERDVDRACDDLLKSLAAARATVVVVSDELGLGGVHHNQLARRYADALGELNQQVAAACDEVHWVVAGIATRIKAP